MQNLPKEELLTQPLDFNYEIFLRYDPKTASFEVQYGQETLAPYYVPFQEITFKDLTFSGAIDVEYIGFPLKGNE